MPELKKKGQPSAQKPKPADKAPERKVIYPDLEVLPLHGEDALTVEQAKDLLGWEEESETVKFGDDYLFVDFTGKKVRCLNNDRNRPFGEGWAKALCQDILNGHWKFNGETIIIGVTGLVLSGQHRLIALVLAEQKRTGKDAMHWEEVHKGPMTLSTIVVRGIPESGETTRTLDNVKPRTFSDVLFCDPQMFPGVKSPAEREKMARWLDHAIKMIWARTLAKDDPYKPQRTHSEGLEFLARHPKLKEALKHIAQENARRKGPDGKLLDPPIGKLIGPGYAVALCYLMGASKSDVDEYRNSDPPSEKQMDFGTWKEALAYWAELGKGALGSLKEVYYALAALRDEDTGKGGSRDERAAILCKGWELFLQKQKITRDKLALRYSETDDGRKKLDECPDVGGIDLGSGRDEEESEGEPATDKDLTPDEVAKQKEEARKKRAEEVARKLKERREAAKGAAAQNGTPAPEPAKAPEPEPKSFEDELAALKTKHGGKLLLHRKDKVVVAWGEDAHKVAKILKTAVKKVSGVPQTSFPSKMIDEAVRKLTGAGHPVGVLEEEKAAPKPEAQTPAPKPAPAAPAGKPPVKPAAPKPTPASGSKPFAPKPAPKNGAAKK